MKLEVTFWFNAHCDVEMDINPADYLHCNDEQELSNEVYWDMTCFDAGVVTVDDIHDTDFKLPDDFVDMWKQLKVLENCL